MEQDTESGAGSRVRNGKDMSSRHNPSITAWLSITRVCRKSLSQERVTHVSGTEICSLG